jgi:flagellar basal body rod protein FlgG
VIGADGSVRAGEQKVGQLRIVTVEDPTRLIRESGTQFAAGDQATTDVPVGKVQLIQGAVEGANLAPVEGLVSMIETVRGFETYMRAAERLDQITGKAISDIGRV